MPRKWPEKIVDFPAYRSGVLCLLYVISVAKSNAPRGMRVIFEHIDDDQAGRRHEQVLLTPIHPAGLTAQFFVAAGKSVDVGHTVYPTSCVGRVVGARFEPDGDGVWCIVAFAPASDTKQSSAPTM